MLAVQVTYISSSICAMLNVSLRPFSNRISLHHRCGQLIKPHIPVYSCFISRKRRLALHLWRLQWQFLGIAAQEDWDMNADIKIMLTREALSCSLLTGTDLSYMRHACIKTYCAYNTQRIKVKSIHFQIDIRYTYGVLLHMQHPLLFTLSH